ncbi:hypothetical protein M758_12G140100 [Ceratodon purpureus]|nr:hypothetical protein M758_12G140100 [Ceratodon purpureus]
MFWEKMGTDKSVLLLMLASMFLVAVPAAPIGSQTYIVHMAKNMSHTDIMAKGAWYNEIMQGAKTLLSETEEDDGKDCVHHVFDKVFNGFSARLTSAQAAYMEKLPGVLKLYPNEVHTVSTTRSPSFLGLTATGAALLNESNYGEGVIIGVIDTGIWPERPSFSDVGLGPIPAKWKGICETGVAFDTTQCNLKIIGARYFLKGNEAMFGPINDTNEYRSPRDLNGHGTHCASTAAGRASSPAGKYGLAEGTAMGMAPKAKIAVYKALWRAEGAGSTDDLVAAIDQAVLDGVDVISFSIGGFSQLEFHSNPIAIATYNAVNQGVFFSASAGNDGPSAGTVENVTPWVTTVAAATQDRDLNAPVELGDGTKLSGRSPFDGTGLNGNLILPLVYAGDAAIDASVAWNASVCQAADFLDVTLVQGRLVLCDYVPSWTSYSDIVARAGAAGIILGNTPASGEALTLTEGFLSTPFTRVGNAVRIAITNYIRATAAPAARILPAMTLIPGPKPAPQVAGFSSRGPLSVAYGGAQWLKPDISAPGVDILAAGNGQEDYAFMSGTSMACPHISGMGALLKAVHPNWSPAAIRSALMTTATVLDNTQLTITAEESGLTASPWAFGAGLALPERAMTPGLVYDMGHDDYFFFLCALGYTTEQIQVFEHGPFTCPPQMRVQDMNLPSFVALFDSLSLATQTPVTFTRTLTSVTTGVSTYNASVVNPQGFTISIDPPTLTFSPTQLMQRFVVTVTPDGTTSMPQYGSHGSVIWTDGLHYVQSPVVATNVDVW